MVHRWRCRHCDYSVWSASRSTVTKIIQSHLLDHHRDLLSEGDFRIQWECPYCDKISRSHDRNEGVERFREHLFSHVKPLLEEGVHVADSINGTGNILVRSPLHSTGADNARLHFLAPGDIIMFVTTNPADRLRLIHEKMSEWPAWTILLTTKTNPLDGVNIPDLSSRPLEVVQINKGMGLADLGETISRILSEQDTTNSRVSFEFDILSEIIEKFDLETTFKFLHLLMNRMENSRVLSHYYVNPQKESKSTINVIDELFDISLIAEENIFYTRGKSSNLTA